MIVQFGVCVCVFRSCTLQQHSPTWFCLFCLFVGSLCLVQVKASSSISHQISAKWPTSKYAVSSFKFLNFTDSISTKVFEEFSITTYNLLYICLGMKEIAIRIILIHSIPLSEELSYP